MYKSQKVNQYIDYKIKCLKTVHNLSNKIFAFVIQNLGFGVIQMDFINVLDGSHQSLLHFRAGVHQGFVFIDDFL